MPPGAPGTAPAGLGSRNEPLTQLQRGCVGVLGLGGWGGRCCWAPAPGRRQRDPPRSTSVPWDAGDVEVPSYKYRGRGQRRLARAQAHGS